MFVHSRAISSCFCLLPIMWLSTMLSLARLTLPSENSINRSEARFHGGPYLLMGIDEGSSSLFRRVVCIPGTRQAEHPLHSQKRTFSTRTIGFSLITLLDDTMGACDYKFILLIPEHFPALTHFVIWNRKEHGLRQDETHWRERVEANSFCHWFH